MANAAFFSINELQAQDEKIDVLWKSNLPNLFDCGLSNHYGMKIIVRYKHLIYNQTTLHNYPGEGVPEEF